jgi:hypothetical protein
MTIVKFMLDYFLKPQTPQAFALGWFLGVFLLVVAAGFSLFFLFEGLVPIIGYLQTGGLLCVALIVAGFIFIYSSRPKKRTDPINHLVNQAGHLVNQAGHMLKHVDMDINKALGAHAPKILVFSFVAGLVLSLLTPIEKRPPSKK